MRGVVLGSSVAAVKTVPVGFVFPMGRMRFVLKGAAVTMIVPMVPDVYLRITVVAHAFLVKMVEGTTAAPQVATVPRAWAVSNAIARFVLVTQVRAKGTAPRCVIRQQTAPTVLGACRLRGASLFVLPAKPPAAMAKTVRVAHNVKVTCAFKVEMAVFALNCAWI